MILPFLVALLALVIGAGEFKFLVVSELLDSFFSFHCLGSGVELFNVD